jgi:hypothetical protein
LSLSLSAVWWHHVLAWKKRGGLFGIRPGVGSRWQGGFVKCGDVWPHRETFHSTASTPLQRRVPISGSSADDGSPEERECKWAGAGAGVHRPTRSHASFCLRLYLVDKESGERTAAERMPRFANRLDPDYRSPLLHTRCAMTSHPSSSVARTATAATATATAQCIFMSLLILSNHHHHFITRVSCFAFSWLCFRFRAWECGVLGLDGHGVAFFVIVQALGK